MSRVLSAARIQLVAWPATLSWPWAILFSSLLVNVLIFASIDDIPPDTTSGGMASIYIVTFIGSIVAISQEFPFGVGLGLTRRAFYSGLALLVLAQSLVYGVFLYLLRLVEEATGGWGSTLRFFGPPFLVHDNPATQILIYATPFTALGFLGTCLALVHKRWSVTGMFALTVALVLGVGGLAVLISWQRWWGAVGHWLADRSAVGLFVGGPAVVALVLAAAGYLMIRRTDP